MNRLNDDRIKKYKIINLTDIGNNNPVRARRLPYGEREPGYVDEDGFITQIDGRATKTISPSTSTSPTNKSHQQPKGLMRSVSDPSTNDINNNNAGFVFAISENRNKELQHGDPLPEDPEPNYLSQLEATGATIIKSETYFPQSRQTVTTRSLTPEEHRAEREQQYWRGK